jgi:hypothetical protein
VAAVLKTFCTADFVICAVTVFLWVPESEPNWLVLSCGSTGRVLIALAVSEMMPSTIYSLVMRF